MCGALCDLLAANKGLVPPPPPPGACPRSALSQLAYLEGPYYFDTSFHLVPFEQMSCRSQAHPCLTD